MKVATWNVNSIRARLDIVVKYLRENPIDVVALQELKAEDGKFPKEPFEEMGYSVATNGQKAYNGVAFLSKPPLEDVRKDVVESGDQKRTIQARINGILFLNVYFPHGGLRGEEKFFFKLEFYKRLKNYILLEGFLSEKFVLLGDFNVALEESDVWDANLLSGAIGFLDEEREALRDLVSIGLIDPLRMKYPLQKIFTWWDYRAGSFRKNEGMRIDYILLNVPLKESFRDIYVDLAPRKLANTSDHAPVILEII